MNYDNFIDANGDEWDNHPDDPKGIWDYESMPDYDDYPDDQKDQFEEDYLEWYGEQPQYWG